MKSRNYHIVFIFVPDKASANPLEPIENILTQHKVEIEHTDNWGEKQLFVPKEKQKHGIFTVTRCKIQPSRIAELSKDLVVHPNILHHMIKKI